MPSLREALANKRHLAGLLFAYAVVLIVVLGTYLRHRSPTSLPVRIWTLDKPVIEDESPSDLVPHHGGPQSVAIGGGITSKGSDGLSETNLDKMMALFTVFLPSFCNTASPGYDYYFYFAYDMSDPLFNNPTFLSAFETTFARKVQNLCPDTMKVSIRTVRCRHDGKPTWAQNDAMLEAYLDGIEYYYRINDDTKMITKGWTDMFLHILRNYVPSNAGVVGPKHYGGNTDILTYDFVHRTHIDVFGFYYPRLFTDWWGDDWITRVYEPYRSTKHQKVYLEHTMGKGRRYTVNYAVGKKLKMQLEKDKKTLHRYINATQSKESLPVDDSKVISMSLFGQDPKHVWGAIRNAQLAPIFFPGWTLRFYVISSRFANDSDMKSLLVPTRILKKLEQLGAEIVYVKTKSIPPLYWRYLVVDNSSVDYFIVRNADNRLNERDAVVVSDWLQHENADRGALHCIRDHPNHTNISIVDGLWGGNRSSFERLLNKSMSRTLKQFLKGSNETKPRMDFGTSQFLSEIIWPLMSSMALCHDSVSRGRWPGAQAFPKEQHSDDFLGQEFDEHQEPIGLSTSQNDSLSSMLKSADPVR